MDLHRAIVIYDRDHAYLVCSDTRNNSIDSGSFAYSLCPCMVFVLTQAFGKQLSQFTFELCKTLDNMIDGAEEPSQTVNSETLFARINHRLSRLYQIMQENRRKVDEERQELQTLVSDISHQVKTPVSNLKMATDTLLTRPVTETERIDFIKESVARQISWSSFFKLL